MEQSIGIEEGLDEDNIIIVIKKIIFQILFPNKRTLYTKQKECDDRYSRYELQSLISNTLFYIFLNHRAY